MTTNSAINRIAHFIDNSDGTVTDTRTGLMWMRCAMGQTWDGATCSGIALDYAWNSAWNSAIAEHITFAGHSDWRVPDIDELLSIVDPTRSEPAIDTAVFLNTPNRSFWSDTPADSGNAHYVSFSNGCSFESGRLNSKHLRLVRGSSVVPLSVYVDNQDGTVTDTRTGLTWMRCALGQTWDGNTCTGKATIYKWGEVNNLAYNYANHNDWRLPILDELDGISDRSKKRPAIDRSTFPETPITYFWTSTCPSKYTAYIYSFNSRGSVSESHGFSHHVRLVRGISRNALLENVKLVESESIEPVASYDVGMDFYEVEPATMTGLDVSGMSDMPERLELATETDSTRSIAGPSETPSIYVDNQDGTVTNTRTGLTWMRCASGQTWDGTSCLGAPNTFTWHAAMARRQDFSGHTDWRLPEVTELQSIVDSSVFNKLTRVFFWTSSLQLDGALGVDFGNGRQRFSLKWANGAVLFVRSGKTTDETKMHKYTETSKRTIPATLNSNVISKPIQAPTDPQKANSDSTEKIDVSASVLDILKRLDLLETRFHAAINRIEIALSPISAGQLETLSAINQLQPSSIADTNTTTDDISGLRLLIERQEIRFDASINSIEMLLKSLFQTQAAALTAMKPVQQTPATNTEILASEIAELRQIIVSALQSVQSTSQNTQQQIINPEPEVSGLDSMATFSAWLVEQDVIPISVLRIRLLPLDLLPGAVINDINERALDLTGEPALVEEGDNVIVQREVLSQVIAG